LTVAGISALELGRLMHTGLCNSPAAVLWERQKRSRIYMRGRRASELHKAQQMRGLKPVCAGACHSSGCLSLAFGLQERSLPWVAIGSRVAVIARALRLEQALTAAAEFADSVIVIGMCRAGWQHVACTNRAGRARASGTAGVCRRGLGVFGLLWGLLLSAGLSALACMCAIQKWQPGPKAEAGQCGFLHAM